MKKILFGFFAVVSVSWMLTSCGGKPKTDDSTATENECVKETSMSLYVDKKGLKDDMSFITADSTFKINDQEFVFINDSSAEIKLKGVSKLASGADNDVVVDVSLFAKNGKTLQAGIYRNMDFESDLFAKVSLKTGAGTIWFNWATGMPDPGAVKINQIDRSSVCGSVHLNVDKPDNNSIGVVKLNGNFFIEE